MIRKVETKGAPIAIEPYSQAINAGGFLFLSGQIPLNPETGKLAGNTIEVQTQQVLSNIEAILKDQNLTFAHVVKVEIFLKNLSDFALVNGIYAETFREEIKPARVTVEVARLPLDSLIEISCIALL